MSINCANNAPKSGIHQRSLELRVVLLEVLLAETHHADDALLGAGDEAAAVPEELDGVDGSEMAADLADLVAVKDVADVDLEARVAARHGCHDGRDAPAHDHVELGICFRAE